jgi:uncharacterized integral membrane protein (TIGR00697 family)
MQTYSKQYLYISILFVAILMISNTVAVKIVQLGPLTLAGGILIFPITYIFGDILTEVYGYQASRPIIWAGFISSTLMALCYFLVQVLPSAVFWPHQAAFSTILGQAPRIVLASLIAYLVGEFINSFIMSRLKVLTRGRLLWFRTIGSTLAGEGADSILFGIIAFAGTVPLAGLVSIVLSGYLAKVAIEVVMTPITYKVVAFLKKHDQSDVYDENVSYNPFNL